MMTILSYENKNLVYEWRNRYVFRHKISATEKRLLSNHKNGTMVTFTVFFNTSSLLSNNACMLSYNACWTVTFRTHSSTSMLIGKQIVYWLTLADCPVIIHFKVKQMRVCDVSCSVQAHRQQQMGGPVQDFPPFVFFPGSPNQNKNRQRSNKERDIFWQCTSTDWLHLPIIAPQSITLFNYINVNRH